MAKVILICGKICSGKSTYAKRIRQEYNAVILSCDELTMEYLEGRLCDNYEEMLILIKRYLYKKAEDIIRTGTNVILDFGFWSKAERESVTKYFRDRLIETQWHYVEVSDELWMQRIHQRNDRIKEGLSKDFYIDDGLLAKCRELFEIPEKREIHVWN